jgi:hypothetical protein
MDAAGLERVVVEGNLEKLTAEERVNYYTKLCESLGLNPLTKPFEYIRLNGKLVLYAKKDATDQLRKLYDVSVEITGKEIVDGVYVVTARASIATKMGTRTDTSIGAVTVAGLKGDALANALMKCESKAKRRVTLSIVGLGMLDETEIETIPDAQRIEFSEPKQLAPPKLDVAAIFSALSDDIQTANSIEDLKFAWQQVTFNKKVFNADQFKELARQKEEKKQSLLDLIEKPKAEQEQEQTYVG